MRFQPLDVDDLVLVAQKPTRYVGGEVHSIAKPLAEQRVTWALAFPDTYEVGMSNLGYRILYQVLNALPGVACERTFMPWPDTTARMRERKLPLWALESRAPVRDFDILGFSLQFEAAYTTCLEMLDLAGIPIHAAERSEHDPLVLAGGPCTCNGEPVAPFFDAMVVGDGEEAVAEISEVVAAWKGSGASRHELLRRLSRIRGVYIPSFFEPRYGADGTIEAIEPLVPGYELVERRLVADLDRLPGLVKPILPFMQTVHDRLSIELQRGCTRGCRFCQAGMLTRPTRQRSPEKVLKLAAEGLAQTGFEEVGFLSLSAGDYPCLDGVLQDFFTRFAPEKIAISLPSLRTETMSEALAQQIGKVRKTGFTIAPEAATDRLRRVINKGNEEANFLAAIESIFASGWSLVKLYFMIGLPTETDEDVLAIADLAKKALRAARRHKPDAQINVSVSTFVPKPFTPFQWERMDTPEETIRKHDLLRGAFPRKGALSLKYHLAESSVVEGALARGDRRMATAIHAAWKRGQILDGWTEHFSSARWDAAFAAMLEAHGVDRTFMANRERGEAELLPWERIAIGATKKWLLAERQRSRSEAPIADCAMGPCGACGACDFEEIRPRVYTADRYAPSSAGVESPPEALPAAPVARHRYRIRYAKTGRAIAISHLETMNVLHRALRRSKLPVSHSQGFNPRPRVSLGPALPVGVESMAEFFDLDLERLLEPTEVAAALAGELPPNYALVSAELLAPKTLSLSEAIEAFEYRAAVGSETPLEALRARLAAFETAESCTFERLDPRGRPLKAVDLKSAVLAASLDPDGAIRFRLRAGNGASAKPSEVLMGVFGVARPDRLLKEDAVFSRTP